MLRTTSDGLTEAVLVTQAIQPGQQCLIYYDYGKGRYITRIQTNQPALWVDRIYQDIDQILICCTTRPVEYDEVIAHINRMSTAWEP